MRKFIFYLIVFTLLMGCKTQMVYNVQVPSRAARYIIRHHLGGKIFVDIQYDNWFGYTFSIDHKDTFLVSKNEWYVKRFGKYAMYYGEQTFAKDSFRLDFDISKTHFETYGWGDSIKKNHPYYYICHPFKKVPINKHRAIYVYTLQYYDDGDMVDNDEYICFDNKVGIVEYIKVGQIYTRLKGYKYQNKLANMDFPPRE